MDRDRIWRQQLRPGICPNHPPGRDDLQVQDVLSIVQVDDQELSFVHDLQAADHSPIAEPGASGGTRCAGPGAPATAAAPTAAPATAAGGLGAGFVSQPHAEQRPHNCGKRHAVGERCGEQRYRSGLGVPTS